MAAVRFIRIYGNRILAIAGILLIVFGIYERFYRLGIGSFWFDELWSVQVARKPLMDILAVRYDDPGKPPFHFLILWLWGRLFGFSELSVRLPMALISTAAVAVYYYFTRTLSTGRTVRWLAAGMFAVFWMHVWGGREARYYSVVLFLATLSTGMLLEGLPAAQSAWFIVVSSLGLLTNILYGYLFLCQAVSYCIVTRSLKKAFEFTAPLLACLPYLVLTAVSLNQSAFSIAGTRSFRQLFGQPPEPPLSVRDIAGFFTNNSPPLTVYLFWFAVFAGFFFACRKGLSRAGRLAAVLSGLLFIVTAVLPTRSVITNSYYLLYLTPAVFYLFAVIGGSLRRWHETAVAAVGILTFLFYNVSDGLDPTAHFNVWRYDRLATFVTAIPPETPVCFEGDDDIFVIRYYAKTPLSPRVMSGCELSADIPMTDIYFIDQYWNTDYWGKVNHFISGKSYTLKEETSFGPVISREYVLMPANQNRD